MPLCRPCILDPHIHSRGLTPDAPCNTPLSYTSLLTPDTYTNASNGSTDSSPKPPSPPRATPNTTPSAPLGWLKACAGTARGQQLSTALCLSVCLSSSSPKSCTRKSCTRGRAVHNSRQARQGEPYGSLAPAAVKSTRTKAIGNAYLQLTRCQRRQRLDSCAWKPAENVSQQGAGAAWLPRHVCMRMPATLSALIAHM